ncbi:MAG: hypothetical protein JWM11_6412 [Planctomycetaceae bacterium]|nr:hypothetical protein [Planctomycetaceae bacterium]
MHPFRPVTSESQPSWFGSFIGWTCLFLAATCYGTVHLAPRLWTMVKLQHDYDTNQLRLVSLEGQLHDLGKMADALETDRDFAQALARVDFPAERPGVQHIAVEPHLSQDPRNFNAKLDVPEPPWPWYASALKSIIENRGLNTILLCCAAFFALLAFIPLHFQIVRVIGGQTVTYTTGLVGFLKNRYYQER